jgi:hypothetical protein
MTHILLYTVRQTVLGLQHALVGPYLNVVVLSVALSSPGSVYLPPAGGGCQGSSTPSSQGRWGHCCHQEARQVASACPIAYGRQLRMVLAHQGGMVLVSLVASIPMDMPGMCGLCREVCRWPQAGGSGHQQQALAQGIAQGGQVVQEERQCHQQQQQKLQWWSRYHPSMLTSWSRWGSHALRLREHCRPHGAMSMQQFLCYWGRDIVGHGLVCPLLASNVASGLTLASSIDGARPNIPLVYIDCWHCLMP